MYALIDPFWGNPKVVLDTIRESEAEAWKAALSPECETARMYSGASQYPMPNGTAGDRERLESFGFLVKPVNVAIAEENHSQEGGSDD